MAREAKLFESSKGSPARALFRLHGNIPPSWIDRARASRKAIEPDVMRAMKRLKTLRQKRPNAVVTIKAAEHELKLQLKAWELAFQKENFYSGLRALLEISRDGVTKR